MNAKDAVKVHDRILYVEPNDLPAFMSASSSNGAPLDNITWDPDKMNIFVDLQVIIPSRQYVPSEEYDFSNFEDNSVKYQSILSGVKLGRNEQYLTSDWTNICYQEIRNNRAGSKEMFGINSIQITFDSHMYPVVVMNFTDVRGSSLMMPHEQRVADLNGGRISNDEEVTKNFFSHLFRFPYPRFLLSVKGIYGTCVTFVLSVEDFKSTFNSETGNFDVVVKFIGNMYGLYTDIPMNYILIAPYIGSQTGGFAKNKYWLSQTANGGDFFYSEDGVSSVPINTFMEFFAKYQNATDDGSLYAAYGDNLRKMSMCDLQIGHLDASGGFLGMFNNIPNACNPQPYRVFSPEGGKLNKWVLLFKDMDSKSISFYEKDFAKNIVEKVKKYNDLYGDADECFNFGKNYGFVSDLYNGISNSFSVFNADVHGKRLCSFLTEEESDYIKGSFRDKADLELVKYVFVYSNEISTDIENYMSRLSTVREECVEGASKEMSAHFRETFDFTPTIENVMRMLFAHIDTFIHEFYDCISQIDGSRTLKTLGGFPKSLTDIESSSEGDAHVPPFTMFYKKRDGKEEIMYPGEDQRLKNIAEVRLVEDILNGIGSMFDWAESYLSQNSNTEQINEEDNDFKFTPLMISDFYYDQNPYDTLGSDFNPYDIIYFFICRMFLAQIGHPSSNAGVRRADIWAQEANNLIHSRSFKYLRNMKDAKDLFGMLKENTNSKRISGSALNGRLSRKNAIFTITDEAVHMSAVTSDAPVTFGGMSGINGKKRGNVSVFSEVYPENKVNDFYNAFFGANSDETKGTFYYGSYFAGGFPPGTTFNYRFGQISGYERDKNDFFIIPLESDGEKYVPYTETVKGVKKVVTSGVNKLGKTSSDIFFHGIKDLNGNYIEVKDYDYNNFIKDGLNEYMWVPAVKCKYKGKKYNLLIKKNNPIVGGDGGNALGLYNAAFLFIHSIIYGDYLADKFLSKSKVKDISKRFESLFGENSCDAFVKLSKVEYLFFLGLMYMKSLQSGEEITGLVADLNVADKGLFDKIGSIFSAAEINEYAELFKKWAKDEFKPKVVDVVSSFGESDNFGKLVYGKRTPPLQRPGLEVSRLNEDIYTTSIATDLDVEYGGAAMYGTQMQDYVISLYRETIVVLKRHPHSTKNQYYSVDWKQLSDFSRKVWENIPDEPREEEAERPSTIQVNSETPDDSKLTVYMTLKNLYDRWLSMETEDTFRLYRPEKEAELRLDRLTNGGRGREDKSEFTNFVYVDSFYNDIGRKFMVNSSDFATLLKNQFDGTQSFNALEFIGKLCQDNKLLFRCLPVYSNVYNSDTFSEIFTPHSLYDGTSRTGRRIGNTYLIMYTYEPSHFLDLEHDKSDGVSYRDDSFDIADSFGDITQEAPEIMRKKMEDGKENYSICAFGVTPAKQNQSYFKKVSIGMDNPRVTDFAIMNKFLLAGSSQRGGTANIRGNGQDMYSIYSNRSYDCSVEMLGCANIMPMMYFQLNNVPMFKGTYMITKVEHSIQNNNMTTKFVGTRMPRRYIPLTSRVFNIESLRETLNKILQNESTPNMTYGSGTVNFTRGAGGFLNVPEFPEPPRSAYEGKTFYVGSAIEQMFKKLYSDNGCLIPISNTGSIHRCATFVMHFLKAGFEGYVENTSCNDTRGSYRGYDGYWMYEFLHKKGFHIVATKSDLVNGTFKPEAGDVCVMLYGGHPTEKHPEGIGHVCMYASVSYTDTSGEEKKINNWVSDFRQGTWHVGHLNHKTYPILEGETMAMVYRFMGNRSEEKVECCIK